MVTFKMSTLLSLALTMVLTLTSLANAHQDAWLTNLQAKRRDVAARIRAGPRALAPRASGGGGPPPVCPRVTDVHGSCCTTRALQRDGECCPASNVWSPECSLYACCENGVRYGRNGLGEPSGCCVSPGVVYTDGDGKEACCANGMVAGDQCCGAFEAIVIGIGERSLEKRCAIRDRVKRQVERPDGSISQMTKRQDSSRTLLSANLVADYLVNNGVFAHDGQEYIDHHHQDHNDGFLRRLAGKGVTTAMRYMIKPGRKYDAEHWEAVPYMSLSEGYEFAVQDVPEIYARIVAQDDFESFNWQGASFDRDMLYRLASGHPGFNESLIAEYR